MPLLRPMLLLALVSIATPSVAAKAAVFRPASAKAVDSHAIPPALALLDSVTARYLSLERFQLFGQFTARIVGGRLDGQKVEVPFLYAAERPGRLHNELRNPVMTTVVVSDGDSLQTYVPGLHQYTRQPAPMIIPGGVSQDPFARSLDPLLAYAFRAPGQPLLSARALSGDTVMTDTGPITCARIEITVPPDSSHPEVKALPRVVWIDTARNLVLRDSLTLEVDHPQLGHLRQVLDTRFLRMDLASGGGDSLYTMVTPEGAQRVVRLGAPGLEPTDLAGQDAKAFTLETLEGKPVALASLRGKVVVLDFWATWCGPCRRWLPIVAKASKTLAPKGVRVFAVNLREPTATVKKYLADTQLVIPVLMDRSGHVGTDYGASSIPLTVIIGRDGRIVKTMVGLHAEDDLRAALAEAGVKYE